MDVIGIFLIDVIAIPTSREKQSIYYYIFS